MVDSWCKCLVCVCVCFLFSSIFFLLVSEQAKDIITQIRHQRWRELKYAAGNYSDCSGMAGEKNTPALPPLAHHHGSPLWSVQLDKIKTARYRETQWARCRHRSRHRFSLIYFLDKNYFNFFGFRDFWQLQNFMSSPLPPAAAGENSASSFYKFGPFIGHTSASTHAQLTSKRTSNRQCSEVLPTSELISGPRALPGSSLLPGSTDLPGLVQLCLWLYF